MSYVFRVARSSLICIYLACTVAPLVSLAQTREETSLWETIKGSKDAEDYKAYLDKYPDGVYAPLAKRRIAQLLAHPSEQTIPETKNTLAATEQSSKQQGAIPVTMTECEGTNNCATWTFLGTQGNGEWPSGEVANLTVESSDASTLVVHRADSTGSSAGLTAVYKGTRHGDRIDGEYTSSWPGHWETKSGNWYATMGKASQSLPSVMRNCPSPITVCSTWTWNNGHYDFRSDNGVTGTVAVASFTPESVVFNRTDYGRTAGYTAIYTGRISSTRNSILNGNWSDSNGSTGHFTATWGTAIDDLPHPGGYNVQSRQRVVVRPVVCYPWFFGVVCSQ